LRMRGHRLPEVRHYADLMLVELRKVIPSFLTRVDRADRGGEWTEYLSDRDREMSALVAMLWPDGIDSGDGSPKVELTDFEPDGEDKILAAMCYPVSRFSDIELQERVAKLSTADRERLMAAYVGHRRNRRHKPGRAFERTSYRFDIVSDYGAFRDMQRHRMLTIEWQPLSTSLGYDVPSLIDEAGLTDDYVRCLERSYDLHEAMLEQFPEQAGYAVALAFNIRYSMQLNAREAMHVAELRSSPQGHPSYRIIAQEMHRLIDEKAGHHQIAAAMAFTDHSEVELGRLEAERRAEARRAAVHGNGEANGPKSAGGNS
jgi:thymidylate synthase ThyX